MLSGTTLGELPRIDNLKKADPQLLAPVFARRLLLDAPDPFWHAITSVTRRAEDDLIAGVLVVGLNLPRGCLCGQHYGAWDRCVF
jgi:hypothetical protein